MPKIETAIITATSVRHRTGSHRIVKRCSNGILVAGWAGKCHIACHLGIVRGTQTLHPVTGQFDPLDSMGWVFPDRTRGMTSLTRWMAALRSRQPLEWRRLLRAYLEPVATVKVAIEDYSLGDLTILCDRGWFAGRSLHAPLWRVYALIPETIWEAEAEFPRFEGEIRSLRRFGAIYDPYKHKVAWK